ncbi:MAG: hypothetical protein ACI9JN_001586 [Bacteroidia bacterium]|jgi:hypothetical protein
MKSISINTLWVLVISLMVGITSCKDETTTPTATAPSDLVYEPNTLTTDVGVSGESEMPSILGSTPITYTIMTTPDAGAKIGIDKNTGIISTTAATAGSYMVSVTASNEGGTVEFKDAFTVDVTSKVKVTYKGNIQGIIMQSCAPCHIYNGTQTNYANAYTSAKTAIDNIIDRVNRMESATGFMPINGRPLNAATLAIIEQWKADGLLEE